MQAILWVVSLLLLTEGVVHAQMPQIDRVEFSEFGIYTLDREIHGRDAAGINKASGSNVRHAASLRTIPAQIGTTFGFRYRVIGRPHDMAVDLRQLIIFPAPGLRTPSSPSPIAQDEFILHTKIGQTSFASYTLEDNFELVPGDWQIELWCGDRKLGAQTFRVAECEAGTCTGF
jgi:hypothetical protein